MPTDPKFRSISRAAGQPLASVVAVFVFMLADASGNTMKRGVTQCNDEDIASALDMDEDAVSAIRSAMQGRVLDGQNLTGWDRRQPKREDNSAERVRAYRESHKGSNAVKRTVTQCNAPDTDTDTDTDTDKGREERLEAPAKADTPKKLTPDDLKRAMSAKRGARLPPDWKPTADHRQMAEQEGFSPSLFNREADSFRDYWLSASGATATKLDWDAAFRNWLRKASEKLGPPNHRKGKTNGGSIQDAARELDEWAAAQESELRARLGGGPDAHDARMLPAK
jgi:hypothetical protein